MSAIRIGIREGLVALRSPGALFAASSFALLWGLGWWLAAPVVDAGFCIGAPADAAAVIQLWTLSAAIIVPMLVMRTVLEPDRTGLLEWRLSGPVRPIGLVLSMMLSTAGALSLFALPLVPILCVSLLHQASVITMLGNLVVAVLLLATWTVMVLAATLWLRSTFLTLLFTLLVPALGLGAVAALPLLADRIDEAGLGWLSTAITGLSVQLASNHPVRLARGLLDGQVELASLVNLAILGAVAVLAASGGLRARAFSGQIGLRRHILVRAFLWGLLTLAFCSSSNRSLHGSVDLTPLGRALPSPRLHDALGMLPDGSTLFLTLNGDEVPSDDLRFTRRILERAAENAPVEVIVVDLAELRRGEISSQEIARWQRQFSETALRPQKISEAMAFLEAQVNLLSPEDHAEVIVGVAETLRRVNAGLNRGVLPDLGAIAGQLSVALQQIAATAGDGPGSEAPLDWARELLILADEMELAAAKLFSGSGGMAFLVDGEMKAFRSSTALLVQFGSGTSLRSESVLSQVVEEFAGSPSTQVAILAPTGSEELVQAVAYELQLRGLQVSPLQSKREDSVVLALVDPPLAVESDPAGYAFFRQVADVVRDPQQNVVLCVGPSIRSRFGLDSPWEDLLRDLGVNSSLESALGSSVTRRNVRQTDLLIQPDWRSDHPVSASVGGLPIGFPLAVDLGSEGACFQWLPSPRRGEVKDWTTLNGAVVPNPVPMGLVRLKDEGRRRLALVGSARWLDPGLRANRSSSAATSGNYELASSLLRWSNGQDALGLGPNAALGRFQPSALERLVWVLISTVAIPLLLLAAACSSALRRSS